MEKVIIYAVEQGSYSDYGVRGIFSTRQKAENYIASFNAQYEEMTIAEWILDEDSHLIEDGYKSYRVVMDKNGNTIDVEWSEYKPFYFDKVWKRGQVNFVHNCWAKDEQHAIKITNEKRLQLIAENKWL